MFDASNWADIFEVGIEPGGERLRRRAHQAPEDGCRGVSFGKYHADRRVLVAVDMTPIRASN
jgi:hypothetical protein